MIRRRNQSAPALTAFLGVADKVDAAQRALLASIPTSRHPGEQLTQALAAFEGFLRSASVAMPEWLSADTESLHERCAAAIEAALHESNALGRVEPALPFEELNARVGDVLHPLEEFADAERTLRRLRLS